MAREIEVLYLQYLGQQIDPALIKEMAALSNEVEKAFGVFRAKVDGKELTENDVKDVLRKSTDSARRRAVWEASKAVGPIIEPNLKKLARLRNRAASQLGFKDYHVMQLALSELNQADVLKLFDELDALTRAPYYAAKAEIDAALARQSGVKVKELRPWHYHDPFFQESPAIYGNYDAVYRPLDTIKLCRTFYAGIGLPIDDVLARSDLYEKPGKCPHAFCQDIDREGEVRVLGNVVPGEEWLGTMLHELGHSVYEKNLPHSVPYVLRTESHALTTEGLAMMFERLNNDPKWLAAMGKSNSERRRFRRGKLQAWNSNKLLIFSRWCQVMFRFEMGLYDNPDQDLNRLWWDLVEKYQEVKRPEGRNQPDYASKIHIVSSPVYYQSYMMGQLFASQVHHAIAREVYHGDPSTVVYVGNPAVGRFLRERVFGPACTMSWNDLTRNATGEGLRAKAFAEDIKD